MEDAPRQLCIVFADISGSTRLYEDLGDTVARGLVADCLELLTEQVCKHNGIVIKTIGDEIMCTFESPERAVWAAVGMQEGVAEDLPERNPNTPTGVTIRIGLHFGAAIVEAGDVFGDAVNVAARMVALAKGGQIIVTGQTVEALPHVLRASTRHVDQLSVKGKAENIDIHEVIWQTEEITHRATGLLEARAPTASRLRIGLHGRERELDQDMETLVLGRGTKADIVVRDAMASREHAQIECRRGRFVLIDMSTNGTYVLTEDGSTYLRREDLVLSGHGKIALGRELSESKDVLTFSCF